MDAKNRRRIEAGTGALGFSLAHPDASAGYATTLARLQQVLARAEQLMNLQRDGIAQVRAATVRKREVRRIMQRALLRHVAVVAQLAAKENPDLASKFSVPSERIPYLEFQALARAMLAEAQNHKELLVKHGLADSVLDGLVKSMAEFDQAMEQGAEGRRVHVSASAELDVLGDETVHLLKIMDTHNHYRFDTADQLLVEWGSASNVFGPVHPATDKPATPPVQPPTTSPGSAAA